MWLCVKSFPIVPEFYCLCSLICFDVFQAWEAAVQVVKDEEAIKQNLCEDLNQLVHIFVKCIL